MSTSRSRKPIERSQGERSRFSRELRFELAGEDARALVSSYALSSVFAAAFLLLVYLTPAQASERPPAPDRAAEVVFDDSVPLPEEPAEVAPSVPTPRPRSIAPVSAPRSAADARDAFGSTPAPGASVNDLLSGVAVSRAGSDGAVAAGSRTVLAAGDGSRHTPGRGALVGTDRGIGSGVTGAVSRASVRVPAPEVLAPPLVGAGRDVAALGDYVRSRQAALQFCYQEHGLKVNPRLAGLVRIAVTIGADGRVEGASVASRSWSGAGAADTEACVLRRVREWRFPGDASGSGSYAFPLNFTH